MMVTRNQLAKFLPDNESIRIFEELISTAETANASAGVLQKLPAQITTTALADSGLFIDVTANRVYKFEFFAAYTSTAGTRFTIDGPSGSVYYSSQWALDASSMTRVNATAYLLPAGVNASALTGGTVKIEGLLIPNASGKLKMQFQSASSITLVAGYSRSIVLT